MWPVVIPARVTWLLQPLDTHIFKRFKTNLRRACLRERILTLDGKLPIAGLVRCLVQAIGGVLGGVDWSRAFEDNGLRSMQEGVCERVRKRVGVEGGVAVGGERPTADEVRQCFPANRGVPFGALWGAFDRPVGLAVVAAAAGPARLVSAARPSSGASAGGASSSTDRAVTRSMSRLAAAASGSGAASSSSAAPRRT